MKNNILKTAIKQFINVVFLLSLFICSFPRVFADSMSYIQFESGCNHIHMQDYSNGNPWYQTIDTDKSFRFTGIIDGNTNKRVYAIFYEKPTYSYTGDSRTGTGSCPAYGSSLPQEYALDGHSYYYFYWSSPSVGSFSANIPFNEKLSNDNSDRWLNSAIYYTYGDGAGVIPDPVDWGILQSPGYSTKIAGSGEASAANIDTVTWSLPYDTNSNDITENGLVDVRAVRGKWAGESAEALQGKDYTTFSLEQSGANLGTVPASQGSFTASWSNVMTALDMASLLILLGHAITGGTWEKDGWIYQIRLRVPDDDYTGEWQTVYTATSTSVQASDTIINSNTYNIDVNQAFTEITQVNNSTSVTYTYNNTEITIENPDAGTEPEGGTNLWDVLKELISGIFQLLAKLGDIANNIANIIGDLIGELLNMIQSLFMPQDIDITVNQQFEEHTQTIKESTGLFGQALNFETNLHDMFYNIEPSEPVLSWPALTVDEVTYIPSGSINLLDYVDDSGASNVYSTFRSLISGVIYFSLFLTILRKLKGVLNK